MKKYSGKHPWYINHGVFPGKIIYAPSAKAYKKILKRHDLPDEPYPDNNGRCTIFTKPNDRIIVITFNVSEGIEESSLIGLIVHECVHAFDFICEDIGENNPSSELKAYTIQKLVQDIYDIYKNLKEEN